MTGEGREGGGKLAVCDDTYRGSGAAVSHTGTKKEET